MAETGIIAALAKALPKLEGAKKNANNPHFKSKYADLGAVIDALDPIIEHGLWYRQQSHDNEGGAMIETFYIHESGEEKSAGTLFMPATKKDAQAFGSALTYARRYGLQCAFGLATEDDDANAAVAGAKREPAKPAQKPADKPGPISDSDIVLIEQYCKAIGGTKRADILKAYKVAALPDLTGKQAEAIIKRLTDQMAEMAKAQTTAEELGDELKY